MENPYKILEIDQKASKDEITKTYRKLAKTWHPDRNKTPEANEKFKKINDAYNYLIDEKKREFLDRHGRRMDDEDEAQQERGFPFGQGSPFGAGFPFGGHHGGSFHMQSGPSPEQIKEMKRKQLHIKLGIELALDQIYTGIKRTIKYSRARVVKGVQKQEENELEIEIKPGAHYGSQIEIKNKGHVIVEDNGSELAGSIIIEISEPQNKTYERDNKKQENLICKKTITFIEALCGFSLELEHPSGKTLFFESNYTIKSTSQYKINNRGLPIFGRSKTFGDIIFKFEIIYPDEISQDEKEKLANIFNYKIKECSRPESEILSGSLITYEETEDNDSDDHQQGQQGQQVQCAQS